MRIDHKLENRSTRLSGGEMQRVAIGRALVRKPAIYLMDEPLSSLDAKLRADLRLELKRIQAELGATMLYVTHDQIEAMTMADRIGILAEGRLVQIGTPREIYTEPANLHVAARLGQPAINLLPAGLLPETAAPAGTKTIGARTEHLTHREGRERPCRRHGRLGRASRRPEPPACDGGHRKLVTLTDPDTLFEKGDRVTVRLKAPALFRRRRQQDRGVMETMTTIDLSALIAAVADTIAAHADELTALDQAIGDGDHGLNMKRGFEAVRAERRRSRQSRCPTR